MDTVSDVCALFGRHVRHIARVPEKLISVTVMPVAYLAVFGLLFGSAITVPGGDYVQYLVAGILAQTMLMNVSSTALGVAEDLGNGLVDRFRAMPISTGSVLAARTGANTALSAVSCVTICAGGLVLGWRPREGLASAAAALALLLLLGWAMSWVGAVVGLVLRANDAITSVAFLVVLPLTFLSNAFIPLSGLPDWLATACEWNPVSVVVAACRDLFGDLPAGSAGTGFPVQHAAPLAVTMALALAALAAPAAVRAYARAAAR
ncbi:ABC transporter permease [Motilibacter deserti]|nr:ABC transporter permease [Motilibacter deserti]